MWFASHQNNTSTMSFGSDLTEVFTDSLSSHETSVLSRALEAIGSKCDSFSGQLQVDLLSLLVVFGCRESSTPCNLRRLV